MAGPLGLDLGRWFYAFDFQPQQSSLRSTGRAEQELHAFAAAVRDLSVSERREKNNPEDGNREANQSVVGFPFHTLIVASNSAMRRSKFARVDVM